jgi:DNA-binding MarR family transcriptional regulator
MSNKVSTPDRTRRRASAAKDNGVIPKGLKHRVDLGLLPSLLGYQLRLAQRAIFADFADSLGELEVSPGLFGMLVVIEANPGLKQSQLAKAAHLDRSSLVPALDKLEARGLVSRRVSEHDRRVNGLWLTDEGVALLQKLKQRVARHEQRLARGLSRSERVQLVALLARIFPEKR